MLLLLLLQAKLQDVTATVRRASVPNSHLVASHD